MNSILYFTSIIILLILVCIIKRSDKKINIIPNIIIVLICGMGYQTLTCICFTYVNIPINLINLTIINTIFVIIVGIIIKIKGIQKFTIKKEELIVVSIIILIVSLISYYDVGNLENIRYHSTDASIHYIAAREFFENEKTLNKTQNTETAIQLMPVAYVNVGILFKALEPIVGQMNFYKIFLFFDITVFGFSAIIFFFIIKNEENTRKNMVLTTIITIIYAIGYPLNNLLSGFHYLGVGCLAINAIIYLLSNKEQSKTLIMFFINMVVILSYSLFAPVAYLSIFIYEAYINRKKYNKLLNKNFIINTIITLIIPGIIGIVYLILPNIEAVKYISVEGYIYKNIFTNIIFFIPFVVYYLVNQIKEKQLDYKIIYFITLILYMLLLYIGVKFKIVSQYYFYKNSYILWTIILIYFFLGIKTFIDKNQKEQYMAIIYLTIYIMLLSISMITNKHILSIYDIYEKNKILIEEELSITQDDINMLTYIYDNNILNTEENNVLFIGDFMQEAWIRSIFNYRNRNPLEKSNHKEYIENWKNGQIKYIVCFEKSNTYNVLKNTLEVQNARLVYETKNAKLYTKLKGENIK